MGYMGYGPRLPIGTIDHRRGLPRLPEGAPLDLDECGGRALVRRRLEIGLRLVGRQRYAMDAAPCAAFRAVAREGARRPSTSFYCGDSRRKRRGARRRRQRARAVGYTGYMGQAGEGGVATKL